MLFLLILYRFLFFNLWECREGTKKERHSNDIKELIVKNSSRLRLSTFGSLGLFIFKKNKKSVPSIKVWTQTHYLLSREEAPIK